MVICILCTILTILIIIHEDWFHFFGTTYVVCSFFSFLTCSVSLDFMEL
jgi:hypothetical protein